MARIIRADGCKTATPGPPQSPPRSWLIQAAFGVPKCSPTMKKDRILGLGVVVFALWAGVFVDASALTLGRARGAAVLGQPFEVSVPLQYGADDDIAASCFNAVVYYGDSMQGGGRVSLAVESGKQANNATIRISSSSSVNEPMVQVELTSRCGANSVRRFTFLSDIAAETLGTVESPAPVTAQAAGSAAVVPAVAASAPAAAASSTAVAGAGTRTQKAKPASPVQKKPRLKLSVAEGAAGKPAAKPPAPNQTQLVDELQARIDELTQKQAASEADKVRVKALEAELQTLQAATVRNQQTVQQLTAAVAKAEEDQSSPTLVYLLIAAVLASVAALAYVVLQRRNGADMRPWWSGAGAGANRSPAPVAPAAAKAASGASKQQPVAAVAAPKQQPAPVKPVAPNPAVDVDIDIDGVVPEKAAAAAPANPVETAPTRGDRRDFMHSGSATLRAINTREMLDVRQQAEFFMALGQHDEAIKVLEANIIGSPDSNPLIYLDLLHVLHTLSRRDAFERYRKEFNLIFTGQVPEYADFLGQGVPLDEYADICEQIAELWPSDDAMEYIEQCMVRTPEDEPEHGFDLEAFRDLLLLHGVLRRLGQTADSSMAPFSTSRSPATIPVPVAPELPSAAVGSAGQSVDGISAPLPTVPDVPLDAPLDNPDSGIDLDLDVAAPASNNLIDFDISSYKGKPVIKDPKA